MKHKPLVKYRAISAASCGLLFVACLLFLLVGLSLPIIKTIFILELKSTSKPQPVTSVATELRFGVWGVCATGALNPPTPLENKGECIGPHLGYEVPASFAADVGVSQSVVTIVQKALLVILVLHPIASGLSLVALISSLYLESHAFSIFTLFLTIVLALLATVVLMIDIAIVVIAKNAMASLSQFHFNVKFGNAVWMALVAVIFIWTAVILLSARACYCCGVRRHHHHHHHHDEKHVEMHADDSGDAENVNDAENADDD
ncbi:hypothetical protein K443DRAFT_682101 [Laccaria amethystina LaAM-08-1]|uniref:Pali-domain-containing protein n=1 Tax=Laccaria amethystina LaAM-08-1 TaxID=1095629 RepID=A0A0C9XG91_9AGAR|nr:hypothetical protein K443DRAFT_682101 [Laccaria amethystina LaAM-08-1]